MEILFVPLDRSSALPTAKQDRHPTRKRNPVHLEDSLSNSATPQLFHQSPWRHSARGYSYTSETDDPALRIITICTWLPSSHIHLCSYISLSADSYCGVLSPQIQPQKKQYETFFGTLGPRFMAGGDFNSKHTAWGSRITTTKGRELFSLMQQYNYSFLSTGRPTYWPSDPAKRPDLLDVFVTNGIS